MKLTNQQINYVENYIISKDIKWYELQVELTGHMINSMEEFWKADPELTFHQVKHYAEERFGRNGFKAIEEERTQILRKEFRRMQWKMIADYLKFPKIFASALALIVVYKSSLYFDKPVKFIAMLYILLLVAYIPSFYSYFRNRKIKGKRFLQIEISNPMVLGFGFVNVGINVANVFKEYIEHYNILKFIYCAVFILGVLALITGRKIYEKSLSSIKKQYQLT